MWSFPDILMTPMHVGLSAPGFWCCIWLTPRPNVSDQLHQPHVRQSTRPRHHGVARQPAPSRVVHRWLRTPARASSLWHHSWSAKVITWRQSSGRDSPARPWPHRWWWARHSWLSTVGVALTRFVKKDWENERYERLAREVSSGDEMQTNSPMLYHRGRKVNTTHRNV